MTPKKLRYPLVRALSTGALASLALLAACEAKLPTAEEVDGMTVASATGAMGRVALMDSAKMTYLVNGTAVDSATANAIAPDSIASIEIIKTNLGTGEVRIATRKPGDAPSRVRIGRKIDSTIVINTGDNVNISASKAPFTGLVVIDGTVRESGAMNTIAPDQIQSINVIKGPAASAKYNDPRAANGVIEITTKKPKP
jgi:outer membrane receptor protein involved in Fe transport